MRWTVYITGGLKRVNHAACAIGDKIYSFGGYCSGEERQASPVDVHVFNTADYRWSLVFDGGAMAKDNVKPEPMNMPAAMAEYWDDGSYNGADNSHSDYNYGFEDDSIQYDDQDYDNAPFMRYGHTVVAYNGKAYFWGGRSDSYGACNKLYVYDPEENKWDVLATKGMSPGARDAHTAVIYNDKMYIFGGFEETAQRYSQEVYAFDFETNTWSEVQTSGAPPINRDFHTAAVVDGKMYIYGGRGDYNGQYVSRADYYDLKIHFLDLETFEWHTPKLSETAPFTGRRSHSMWVYKDKIYIFGGYNSTTETHFNDLFRFDPKNEVWEELHPNGLNVPSVRRRQCSLVIGDRVYVFGGTKPNPRKKDSLIDLNDLFVLEFGHTLTSICLDTLRSHSMLEDVLPLLTWDLREEVENRITPNSISV